jgi:hypothetical protein
MSEKNNEKNIVTLEFGNQNIPLATESKNTSNETFVHWGLNNIYPNFLLGLYSSSASHSAVVNQKSNYIIGGGIRINELEPESIMVNSSDSLGEFTKKVIIDYLLFNAFAVEVLFNVFNEPVAYHHIPVHKIRMNKSKTKFFYSEDWFYRTKNITYSRYSPKKNTDNLSKIFYFDGYFPSINNVYPTPEYDASIKAIVTDAAICEFNLNNIRNQFSPSNIITFFNGSNVTEAVKRQITDEIDSKFRGESGKKYIIDFQHKDGKAAEIKQLSAGDWDKAYVEVNNRNIDNIMIGHQVQNPSLFGIKTSGQLGSSSELQASYEMFKNNYISVKRGEITTALNQLFLNFKLIAGPITFFDKPLFQTQIGDGLREKIYTIDELRNIDGSEPLPNGAGNRLIGEPLITAQIQQSEDVQAEPFQTNDSIKNLTGRQHQNVMRIVRQYGQGRLTKSQASVMLKNGFGFNDVDVEQFLGIDEQPMTETEIQQFLDEKKNFKILSEEDYELVKDLGTYEEAFEYVEQQFDREGDLSIYLIENDLNGLTKLQIAEQISKDTSYNVGAKEVSDLLKKLTESGLIKYNDDGGKIKITPNKIEVKPQGDVITVMYKYSKRPEVDGNTLISTSRGFCVKVINNNKLYTRSEIQQMSAIFGYDVFNYCGGFYHNPDTDETTAYCRHQWIEKKVKLRK